MRIVFATAVVALVAATGATAASSPGFHGCKAFTAPHSKLQVKPASIVAACGDGNFYFTKIHWASWNAKGASGTGLANANSCTPNCAAGKFHTYPARVSLAAAKTCHGHTEFTKLAWTFTGARPKGMPKTDSQTFPCA